MLFSNKLWTLMRLKLLNELLRDILFTSCFIDAFLRLKHWLSDYIRHMFFHVYFTLKLVVQEGKGRLRSLACCRSFELRCLYRKLSHHIKERQNVIYCLNFLKQLTSFDTLKDKTFFLFKRKQYIKLDISNKFLFVQCCMCSVQIPNRNTRTKNCRY